MRSCKGGWHGLAEWSRFGRFPETAAGLRNDDGADSLSDAGSSLAAPDLRLAGLRHVSEISGGEGFPGVLGGKAPRTASLGYKGALQGYQARRVGGGWRRVPASFKETWGSRVG